VRITRYTLLAALLTLTLGSCDFQSGPAPVVLIGIDGAEWDVIHDMIADGELPNLARIRNEGAWGWLMNPVPAVSPLVWTTFSTGHFGRQHGILAHTYPYTEGGDRRPVSSDMRQVPALWNIASHYGKKSAVVGYFVTHPPETINGVIVSPYAPRDVQGSISPGTALETDSPRYQELKDPAVKSLHWAPYFGWDFHRSQARDKDSPYHDAAAIVAEKNIDKRIVEDEWVHRAAMDLLDITPDLFISYYRITDFMSHSLWLYYDETDPVFEPRDDHRELFNESLKQSYRFTDAALGDLLNSLDGKANIMIVSDHGFGPAKDPAGKVTRQEHLTGNHRPNGVVLAVGPDIVPGEIRDMTVMEVAPTLLALLGLPVSDELPGAVHTALLTPDFLEENPIRGVTDYRDVIVQRGDVEVDLEAQAEDMNTLRGLGYIGEGVDLSADSDLAEFEFWAIEERLLITVVGSEIIFHLMKEDFESADAIAEALRIERPDLERHLYQFAEAKALQMSRQTPYEAIDLPLFKEYYESRVLAMRERIKEERTAARKAKRVAARKAARQEKKREARKRAVAEQEAQGLQDDDGPPDG
jgi:predicted AlkP superfamily phosphohydrolase/phosphomutase